MFAADGAGARMYVWYGLGVLFAHGHIIRTKNIKTSTGLVGHHREACEPVRFANFAEG